ncbi:hypothetical protein HOLleu_01183 [Holothuria leucospilota]|uniref:Uncharacterized protein n=1 Tax=Holothuria leucospilota TaxID=206669 RepID=A0A9Q1HKS9_HOLLE|nr:hypothetical protein HOLleu_01183 [Holothuria leucospilota]
MWICYGERKNPVVFGDSQRSSGFTRGQSLKTLFIGFLKMLCDERKNPIVFGVSQSSLGATRGQSLKLVYPISQGRKLG